MESAISTAESFRNKYAQTKDDLSKIQSSQAHLRVVLNQNQVAHQERLILMNDLENDVKMLQESNRQLEDALGQSKKSNQGKTATIKSLEERVATQEAQLGMMTEQMSSSKAAFLEQLQESKLIIDALQEQVDEDFLNSSVIGDKSLVLKIREIEEAVRSGHVTDRRAPDNQPLDESPPMQEVNTSPQGTQELPNSSAETPLAANTTIDSTIGGSPHGGNASTSSEPVRIHKDNDQDSIGSTSSLKDKLKGAVGTIGKTLGKAAGWKKTGRSGKPKDSDKPAQEVDATRPDKPAQEVDASRPQKSRWLKKNKSVLPAVKPIVNDESGPSSLSPSTLSERTTSTGVVVESPTKKDVQDGNPKGSPGNQDPDFQ